MTLATLNRSELAQAAAQVAAGHLDAYGAWVHGRRPAPHHRVWIDAIEETISAPRGRLLIIAPPGHAKSTIVSLELPAWYLGNHPDHSLLFFTSADTMAHQFDGTVRGTLEESERHAACFPAAECRPDKARGWSSDGRYLAGTPAESKDPAYRAVGWGATAIGARAHGIIIDDPLTQEQAQSEVSRRAAKDYADMTVDSRLHPDGWIIAIMTRWHQDDLAAHFMSKDRWRVLHMPALATADEQWTLRDGAAWRRQEGDALWEQRFSRAWLEAKRAEIGGPLFACEYQGDPAALGGSVFLSRGWFRRLPDGLKVERLKRVQFWDVAFSERDGADYSVCCTLGTDDTGCLYVLGVHRQRYTPAELRESIIEQYWLHQPGVIGIEETAYKQAVTRDIVQSVLRRLPVAVLPIAPDRDKVSRARLPAARAEAGMVYVDLAAPWAEPFVAECTGFPLGAHDDQVDAFSGAALLALENVAAVPQKRRLRFG